MIRIVNYKKQSLIQFRFILWGKGPLFYKKTPTHPFYFLHTGLVTSQNLWLQNYRHKYSPINSTHYVMFMLYL